MITIKHRTATKNGKWKIGNKYYVHKKRVISKLEDELEARQGEKNCVRVNYGKGYHNETLDSIDNEYLLWATGIFME